MSFWEVYFATFIAVFWIGLWSNCNNKRTWSWIITFLLPHCLRWEVISHGSEFYFQVIFSWLKIIFSYIFLIVYASYNTLFSFQCTAIWKASIEYNHTCFKIYQWDFKDISIITTIFYQFRLSWLKLVNKIHYQMYLVYQL